MEVPWSSLSDQVREATLKNPFFAEEGSHYQSVLQHLFGDQLNKNVASTIVDQITVDILPPATEKNR